MIKSVKTIQEKEKVVLVRTDYNIPEDDNNRLAHIYQDDHFDVGVYFEQEIKDLADERIRASLPTIKHLMSDGHRIVILSHQGRPQLKDVQFSMKYIAKHLAHLLNLKFADLSGQQLKSPEYPVNHLFFVDDLTSLSKDQILNSLNPGDVLFLENLRFWPQEKSADQKFAETLAKLGDYYVNECFSVSHRQDSSVALLPKLLPSYGGIQLLGELEKLGFIAKIPRRPATLIVGGAKITDKARMLAKLAPEVESILIGGALANLFLSIKGYEIGKSLVDQEGRRSAEELLRNFSDKIKLPTDVVAANSIDSPGSLKGIKEVNSNEKILDIGPETILSYSNIIKQSQLIIWNGPMGLFEKEQFAHGTLSLARLAASVGSGRAFTAVGGGDTVAAFKKTKLINEVDFVSTGGGAMLAYLGGEPMPGLEALE